MLAPYVIYSAQSFGGIMEKASEYFNTKEQSTPQSELLLLMKKQIEELIATEQILRVENKKLKDEAQLFSSKIANMRDRELESRVRSSVHEDMLTTLFEKLMDKI